MHTPRRSGLLEGPGRVSGLRRIASRVSLIGLLLASSVVAGDDRQVQKPAKTSSLPAGVTDDPLLNSRFLFFAPDSLRRKTLRWIQKNHRIDMAAALIHAMRFHEPDERDEIAAVLRALTGEQHRGDWFKWMLWIEAHPEVVSFAGFDVFLSSVFGNLDPVFKKFVFPGMRHRIRVEEIVWGGVGKDGIPALTNPKHIPATDADCLVDDELVFGVVINQDVRAYPFRYMDWHEMLNDVVGGVPVSLAYCTLCGSGILFDTRRTDDSPFVFGSSGLLYRSNKLMFDQQTSSLWNQFTGEPVTGALTDSGLALPVLPVTISSWGEWRRLHSDTLVLADDTGFERDYRPGAAYARYFGSDALMFPALVRDNARPPKAYVFVLRITGAERAWPLDLFEKNNVINDQVGVIDIVLVGNAQTRTVRAYRRGKERFASDSQLDVLIDSAGSQWTLTEDALIAQDGRTLARLPGHVAYTFAFDSSYPRGG